MAEGPHGTLAELLPDQPTEVPAYDVHVLTPKHTRHCVIVPVINEGDRIGAQLVEMAPLAEHADIVIADGGSTDGSLELERLRAAGVRALLVKTGPGRLSAQLRMGFAFATEEGYDGVITVDGNGKDGVEAIPAFVEALDAGYDFVQGSRFIRGGVHERTPWSRLVAIRFLHAPMISLLARHRYTDTTNGFRAHSRRMFTDRRVQMFRDVFARYELLAYFSVRAPRLGFRVKEVPTRRSYPEHGRTPTKLGKLHGPLDLLGVLWQLARGRYNPPNEAPQDSPAPAG
jgi:glycosyltransferase involved in cell wall biosynthesis